MWKQWRNLESDDNHVSMICWTKKWSFGMHHLWRFEFFKWQTHSHDTRRPENFASPESELFQSWLHSERASGNKSFHKGWQRFFRSVVSFEGTPNNTRKDQISVTVDKFLTLCLMVIIYVICRLWDSFLMTVSCSESNSTKPNLLCQKNKIC